MIKRDKNKERPSEDTVVLKKTSGGPAKSAGKKSKTKSAKGIIAAVASFALLCALTAAFSAYVSVIETVFPNVVVDGVDVGGMTYDGAVKTLREAGVGGEDYGVITVHLPAGIKFEVKASISPEAAGMGAYRVGRGQAFIANALTYVTCLVSPYELSAAEIAGIEEEQVRSLVEDAAKDARARLLNAQIEIGEDSIKTVKGLKTLSVDESEITSRVYAALLASDYRDIEFADTDVEERELDIQSLYDSVYAEPLSAEYDPEAHAATESVTGVSFDMDEAKKLWDEAEYGATVEIPLIKTEPEVTTEYLNSILFRDCLSQKSTTLYGSSSNRINNITLAAQSLNSVVVNPGESLSYNKALGRRTAEAGYLAAGAYSAGQVVYEIGGGICQGSSTLYYCALLANLQIDNRVCHMFPVAYLPPGMDATVSWPTPDFKFTNNRPYPIRIEAYVNAGELTIKLWGTDTDGSYVEMTYGTWFIYTDAEHPGEATGYKAASYRWVYASDGTVVSKKLEDYSTYYYHKEEEEEPEETPTDPTPPPTDPNAPPTDPNAPPTDPNVPTGPTDGTGPGGDGAGEGGTGEGTGTEGAGTDGTGTDGTGTGA